MFAKYLHLVGQYAFGPVRELRSPTAFALLEMRPIDADNNSRVDIAAYGHYLTQTYVLHNNGDGTFGTKYILTPNVEAGYMLSQKVGDVDGDGVEDIAVAMRALDLRPGDTFGWYKNYGNGTFVYNEVSHERSIGILLADFDMDNHTDLIVATPQHIRYYRGDGGISWASYETLDQVLYATTSVELFAYDFDDNGYLDVAFVQRQVNSVSYFMNMNGSFGGKALIDNRSAAWIDVAVVFGLQTVLLSEPLRYATRPDASSPWEMTELDDLKGDGGTRYCVRVPVCLMVSLSLHLVFLSKVSRFRRCNA